MDPVWPLVDEPRGALAFVRRGSYAVGVVGSLDAVCDVHSGTREASSERRQRRGCVSGWRENKDAFTTCYTPPLLGGGIFGQRAGRSREEQEFHEN